MENLFFPEAISGHRHRILENFNTEWNPPRLGGILQKISEPAADIQNRPIRITGLCRQMDQSGLEKGAFGGSDRFMGIHLAIMVYDAILCGPVRKHEPALRTVREVMLVNFVYIVPI